MLLSKLSATQVGIFDEAPEAHIGLHFAKVGEEMAFVLSGRVLMIPVIRNGEAQKRSDALAEKLWFGPEMRRYGTEAIASISAGMTEREIEDEESLIDTLYDAPRDLGFAAPTDPLVMAFILHSYGYSPPAPRRPAYVYGHLPFSGVTQAGDVFYRCEHWATSRRVLRGADEVLAGTYGFPESELNFVPTGFAAVAAMPCPICLQHAGATRLLHSQGIGFNAAPLFRSMVRRAAAWK